MRTAKEILRTSRTKPFTLPKYVVFDIEADGLLDTVSKVHCICTVDQDGVERSFGPDQIEAGLRYLSSAAALVGHNILGYDLVVLEQLHGWTPRAGMEPGIDIIDTEVQGRLHYPAINDQDYGWAKKNRGFLPYLWGRHSLEAWGYRLGYLKGTYGKTADFTKFTPELLEYCQRDVRLNRLLLQTLLEKPTSQLSMELEHKFSVCIDNLMKHGVLFDVRAAEALTGVLQSKRAAVADRLLEKIPPFVKEYVTPKKKLKRIKTIPFNPGSRTHIARLFKERYGWKPKVFTETGLPKVDETVLKRLAKVVPVANEILEHFLLDKRLSQIAEGTQAWLKQVKPDGRIYHRINHCGANTGRCTHSKPNLGQVPRSSKPYGKECRGLFKVGPGKKLVGGDAQGLELRCLAHYMAKYDGGAYVKRLLESDIHIENMKDAGLSDRDQAKTFIYALIYGAGPTKMGKIVKGSRAAGQALMDRFMQNLPALAKVTNKTKAQAKAHGRLLGADGRWIHTRHVHSALNAKLQGAGAIVMKAATVILRARLIDEGYKEFKNFAFVLHVHDEFQLEVDSDKAANVKKHIEKAIEDAGSVLDFRCPLAGSSASGDSWAETH